MLGAIVGDIVGSIYEFHNIKTKDFELFSDDCFFTDDSIMTIAIAKAILVCKGNYTNLSDKAIYYMKKIGRQYPYCGYGGRFFDWIFSDDSDAYNSFGNGAAMRVSCCGDIANSIEEAKDLSKKVTAITHDHPEGIKGAEATSVAIYLARHGKSKDEIRNYINKYYYDLDFTLDEIRQDYKFDETCQGTVPQAIECFLESTDFEDAIRNAISIGGDSDTMGAITGGIAEAFYGIPDDIREEAVSYLDYELEDILDEFEKKLLS